MKGNETKTIDKKDVKEELKSGGTFVISAHDLEMLSAEQMQIDGLIALAKEDRDVKCLLLKAIMENFFNELEHEFADWFASQGVLKIE